MFGALQDNERSGNANASRFEGDKRVTLNERAMEDQVSDDLNRMYLNKIIHT